MVGSQTVGVVIVSFNAGELLLRAIGSALAQSRPPDRVLVIENASTDGSAESVASTYPEVELLRLKENIGFAAANNIGIDMLDDCEFVALLNPDAFADPDWLESLLVAAEQHPEFASFASTIERADGSGQLDSAGDVYHVYGTAWPGRRNAPAAATRAAGEVFGPSGAAAFYRRDWLIRVGGFDERFFCYFEDVDLNLRLQVAGGRCLYVPEARVATSEARAASGTRLQHLPLAAQPRLDVREVDATARLLALPADARPAQPRLDRLLRRPRAHADAAARQARRAPRVAGDGARPPVGDAVAGVRPRRVRQVMRPGRASSSARRALTIRPAARAHRARRG